jgi:molecular chaperone GrpE (heat shock protein)
VAPFEEQEEKDQREVADDETVTSREEAGEPSGDLDEANEAEIEEATERPDVVEDDDPAAQLKRERDEYLDLAKRAQADFENYRKRAAKEAAAAGWCASCCPSSTTSSARSRRRRRARSTSPRACNSSTPR